MLSTRYDVLDMDWGDLPPAKDALQARLDAFAGFVRHAHGGIGARCDPPDTRYFAVAGEYMAARPRLDGDGGRYRRKNNGLPPLDDAIRHDTPIVDPIPHEELCERVVPFLKRLSAECRSHYIFLDAYYRFRDRIFNECLIAFAGDIVKSAPKMHEDENAGKACPDAAWDSKPCPDRDRHLLSFADKHGSFELGFEICMDNYRRCLADLVRRPGLSLPHDHLKISGTDSARLGNARPAVGGLYVQVDQGARPSRFFLRTGGPDDAPRLRETPPDACEPLPGGGVYKTLLHRRPPTAAPAALSAAAPLPRQLDAHPARTTPVRPPAVPAVA